MERGMGEVQPVIQWRENRVVKLNAKIKKEIGNRQEDTVKMDSLKRIPTGIIVMMVLEALILMIGAVHKEEVNQITKIAGKEDHRFQAIQEFRNCRIKEL